MKKRILFITVLILFIFTSGLMAQATVQTLTILGGFGTQGEVDPYTEASRDNGATWGPAYLTGWHPWGFATGTNSWVNFHPSPFVGLYSTTDYRIRFYVPSDYQDPHMTFLLKADNQAFLHFNGTFISEIWGSSSGSAGDQTLAQAIQPGLNEITIRLIDYGGWVGLNYRIDLSMISEEEITLKPAGENEIALDIDIKPGSDKNPVNLKSKGVIPVAVLSNDDFDATTLDVSTLRFGPGEAEEAHGKGHIEDVDGDGDNDLVLHFNTQDANFTADDTEGCLIGKTADGVDAVGCDNITINSKAKKEGYLEEIQIPEEFALKQNFPNPFNPTTTISFQLPSAEYVTLKVYDILGNEIVTLANGHYEAGYFNLQFNASDLSSGIYVYRLTAGKNVQTNKMILNK